jgi:hypothetical protein
MPLAFNTQWAAKMGGYGILVEVSRKKMPVCGTLVLVEQGWHLQILADGGRELAYQLAF